MNFTTSSVTSAIGTPGSPAALAASASNTATAVARTNAVASPNLGAGVFGEVIVGASVPTTNPTVQPVYTVDGVNYIPDGGPYVVPMVQGTYPYRYSLADAPPEAVGVGMVVTNGATNGITNWFQTVTLAVS